jgi:hypothetical protein
VTGGTDGGQNIDNILKSAFSLTSNGIQGSILQNSVPAENFSDKFYIMDKSSDKFFFNIKGQNGT